jgi:hypothetical protein
MNIRKIIREVLSETITNKVIAYHGTNSDFSIFDDINPIFFVDNPEIARTYGDRVIKVELNIENPVVFDFGGNSTYFFNNKWMVPSELALAIKDISDDIKNHYSIDDEVMEELEYHEYSQFSGDLDGIIMKDIKDAMDGMFSTHDSATNYVVFNKSQIKVAK